MSQSLCKDILALDDSISFVAVANSHGTLMAEEYRNGLNPLMTKGNGTIRNSGCC